MNTFNKNQRRILKGLLLMGAEREAGIEIAKLRKMLSKVRIGCNNLETIEHLSQEIQSFEKYLYTHYDNLPESNRIFRVVTLYRQGMLKDEDLSEFDETLRENFDELMAISHEEQ